MLLHNAFDLILIIFINFLLSLTVVIYQCLRYNHLARLIVVSLKKRDFLWLKKAGKEVDKMFDVFSFALAVLSGVIANLIFDWMKGGRNRNE